MGDPEDLGHGGLDGALDGLDIGLPGEAVERRAVVGNNHSIGSHRVR